MAGDLTVPNAEEGETGSAMPEVPERAREMLAMFGQFGPAPWPLEEKLTSEHISKMLEIDRDRVGNERAAERGGRYFHAGMFVILCAFILSLVHMLLAAGNDQLTEKILIGLVTLVAGVAGGYGVGKSRC